jgi:hypothetical protein
MRAKSMSPFAQLDSQFLMIVDFAIENDGRVAIIGGNRLASGLQINNLQARGTD